MKPLFTKIVWLVFALAGAPFAYWLAPGRQVWAHAAAVAAVGLGLFFFSRETVDDERVQQLKLRALRVTFLPTLVLSLALNMVVLNPQEPDLTIRSASAFDFASMMMLGSSALFYFWRWRDGRSEARN